MHCPTRTASGCTYFRAHRLELALSAVMSAVPSIQMHHRFLEHTDEECLPFDVGTEHRATLPFFVCLRSTVPN